MSVGRVAVRGRGHGGRGMGRPVEKAKDFKGTLKRLVRYLAPKKWYLAAVFLFSALSTVFSILGPKIMGKATTKLFEGLMAKFRGIPGARVDFGYIGNILLTLLGLYVLSAAFNYIQHYIMAGVAQGTVYDMRRDVNAKLAKLPLKFYDSHAHGDVLSRVTNDVDNISATLQQSLTQLVSAFVTMVGVVVMMLTISPSLTLLTLVTLPLSIAGTALIAGRSQKYFAGQQKSLGELDGHVEEMFTGHKIVKAFGHEELSIQEFEEHNHELYEYGWKAQFISGMIMPLMSFINNLGYVIVCVVGGIFVTQRRISIGDVQAFINYSRQFSQPIVQTANIVNIIQSTVASAERVFEILDEPEEIPDSPGALTLDSPEGNVAFRNVDFSYSKDVPLIEDMNIQALKGQTVAIVGHTGAGKTTLVNLLMRFYEIDGGEITLDGYDIRHIRRDSLRRSFGMVLQDPWVFSGTIRENIAYGREGAKEDEIRQAAIAARADHFVRTLPQGYDTVVNEGASNISQGQMQLLTIARAFLADPAVLILDEATSSVDTRTELLIQKAMKDLMKGRTSFVIAHRLSTIKGADLILVMDHGKIVEKGTHKELMAKHGFYYDLYTSQFAGVRPSGKAVSEESAVAM